MKQCQGSIVATILAGPKTKDVDISIVTHGGVVTREDGPHPHIQLDRKNKALFDITTEKIHSLKLGM